MYVHSERGCCNMKTTPRLFILVMLLVIGYLLIFTAGSRAEYVNIADLREEVKDGWRETYQAYGRTVAVNIPVDIPEVEQFPVLRVKKAPAVPDELLEGYKSYGNSENHFSACKIPAYIKPAHQGAAWFKTTFVLKPGEVDWDHKLTDESPLTAREASGIFRRELTRFFSIAWEDELHLESLWVKGRLYEYFRKTKTFGEPVSELGSYEFAFVQKLKGIPVLVDGSHGFSPTVEGERHPPSTRVSAMIFTEDYLNVSVSLVNVLDEPYPDIPLLSFKRVKAEYEKLILAGLLREVTDLSLGYMLYLDPVEEDIFWAVPVWTLTGIMYDDAKSEAPPPPEEGYDTRPTRRVILLAQNGTIVQGNNDSPFRYYVPAVLTWDEVK